MAHSPKFRRRGEAGFSASLRLWGVVLLIALSAASAPAGDFAISVHDGVATCETIDTPIAAGRREGLHVITPVRTEKVGPGLRIVLRATDQLEQYPQAKAAYLRAAATWERVITDTPMTIVVDVDFGPTYFGTPFPANVLGVTDSQTLFLDTNYAFIRAHLIAAASSDEERALYERLPEGTVPTDIGSTRSIYAPSALLRALHFLPPEAKPKAEHDRGLGNPPAIAVASSFAFDFDPSDGVDADKRNFEAVVLHELGHVLGFTSTVGSREQSASFPVSLSVLDLFRFRPGVTLDGFGGANRIQSSGGEQVFFDGGGELPLSTGRQDATGGDMRQASHWKDEAITGEFIGLMHPALKLGVHETLTANDLRAFDRLGYTLASDTPPAIAALTADIEGDDVVLTGTLANPDPQIAAAQVTLLDGDFRPVTTLARSRVDFGQSLSFALRVSGISLYPQALVARLALFDETGDEIGSAPADFSLADPGGATIKRAKFASGALTIKGQGFAESVVVEVNGVALDVPAVVNHSGTRVKVRGSRVALGLAQRFSRVRVISPAGRSNAVVLELE